MFITAHNATMSTTESKTAASAFSYAQAARSSAAAKAQATFSSQTTSGTSTPSKDVSFTAESTRKFTTAATSSQSSKADGENEITITGTDTQKYTFDATIPASIPTSPSCGKPSSEKLAKEDIISPSQLSNDWRCGDRPKQSDNHEKSERSVKRKGKGKKKEAAAEDAEPEVPKPVEVLVAAPPPAVNIWAQRMGVAKKPVDIVLIVEPANESSSQAKASEKKKTKSQGSADAGPVDHEKGQTQKKTKDESKRSAPRGARQGEKDASKAPPPVEDAFSWPTPETAIEKVKAREKAEKDEKDANSTAEKQPRAKEKWVPVPYTPSVTFNTPLPGSSRGSRGRGGRERGPGRNETGGRQTSGDKAGVPATTTITPDSRERGRNSISSGRASSLPPHASKRVGDSHFRAGAKPFEKETPAGKSEQDNSIEATPSSIIPEASQTPTQESASLQQLGQVNGVPSDAHAHPPSQPQGPRQELNARSAEFHKDAPHHHARAENTRGRGGYRGRGSHFNNGGHMYANGQPPMGGFPVRPHNYSPPQQYGNGFAPRGRGGARGMTNGNPMLQPRFPSNPMGATQFPLQSNGMMFDYNPATQPMSPMPFGTYGDNYGTILGMVTTQIEYYFSIDNLCKDLFLRRHMDSQGFVFLSFVAGFKRIQSLTQDFEILRYACQESQTIEIVVGEDGVDRIRRLEGWEKFVLPMEERDDSAKNAGPERFFRQSHPIRNQQLPGMMPQQGMPQPHMFPNGMQGYPQPYQGQIPMMNGQENGYAQQHHETQNQSPLSAQVPDFKPETSYNVDDYADAEITFQDDEVNKLTVVYTEKFPLDSTPKAPFHNAASRTFSNGSIDARFISEELEQLEKKRNGNTETPEMYVPFSCQVPFSSY